MSGAGMLIERRVLESFYEANGEYLFTRLFMYWDDQAFCHAAEKLNYQTVFARGAKIYHREATSSGGTMSPLVFYYRERNKILAAGMTLSLHWQILFHALNPLLASARISSTFPGSAGWHGRRCVVSGTGTWALGESGNGTIVNSLHTVPSGKSCEDR